MKYHRRTHSEIMAGIHERCAERSRRHALRLAFKFPIVAYPATNLPADRNDKGTGPTMLREKSDLSAGTIPGEGR